MLVDNESSDIMYMIAYQQLRLDPKRLKPFKSPLVSFSGDRIYPKGIITLLVTTSVYPAWIIKQVDFLIVNCPSFYNVILGRPTLNLLKAVTSNYCLKVKFLTPNGIRQICGDQQLARKCYQALLASKENHARMVEKESKKPTQELEDVSLVEETLPR